MIGPQHRFRGGRAGAWALLCCVPLWVGPGCTAGETSEGTAPTASAPATPGDRAGGRVASSHAPGPAASADPRGAPEPRAVPEPRRPPAAPPARRSEPAAPPATGGTVATGTVTPGVPVALVPAKPASTRSRRRMTIDQLDAAIRRVTGGTGWDENGKNQFEVLAQTLGKPNFIDQTTEDLEPSALFQKFLGDAARSVCARLVEREVASAPEERVLMVDAGPADTLESAPDAVESNLRRLLLRYHGARVPPGAPALQPWRWLFQSATHVSSDPVTGWRAVCIALLSHPDFYLY